MHKIAPNCTYIEDNVDMSNEDLHQMYEDAYQRGYEQAKREASQISPAPRNVRDFFYSLGKSSKRCE